MYHDQSSFAVRFEWGERGLEAVGRGAKVIVIVDVLSFGTCVDVATSRGATVLPYPLNDDTASQFADEQRAILADRNRTAEAYCLSPKSLEAIPPGTRLVLPSPNGATLSLIAGALTSTVAACLRNAEAVAAFVRSQRAPVAVIACGERWADGSLRPCLEDLIGAGAVIAELTGTRSPEAQAACDAFSGAGIDICKRLAACSSGRELIERGFACDVELAAALGVSTCVPLLSGKAFDDRGS